MLELVISLLAGAIGVNGAAKPSAMLLTASPSAPPAARIM